MGSPFDGENKPKPTSAEIYAGTQLRVADKNNQTEIDVAKINYSAERIHSEAEITGARITADGQVRTAKINNDPITFDANEIAAYELIKKTGILRDLGAFEAKLIAGDKEAISDAVKLEKALKKDGKDLTADGKITEKTIEAAKGLIGENLDLISKYEEVMQNLAPGAAGKASGVLQKQ
jgi:hypothetical protein